MMIKEQEITAKQPLLSQRRWAIKRAENNNRKIKIIMLESGEEEHKNAESEKRAHHFIKSGLRAMRH